MALAFKTNDLYLDLVSVIAMSYSRLTFFLFNYLLNLYKESTHLLCSFWSENPKIWTPSNKEAE